jgi:hypothetical protein
MALKPYCIFNLGRSPIIAAAIHNGHDALPDVESHFAIDDMQRLHEEDPYTGEWAQIAKTQIVGLRTRFEVVMPKPGITASNCRMIASWLRRSQCGIVSTTTHSWTDPPFGHPEPIQ